MLENGRPLAGLRACIPRCDADRGLSGRRDRNGEGRAFGENGEGCLRIALVESKQRLQQAMRQIDRAVNPRPAKPAKARKGRRVEKG